MHTTQTTLTRTDAEPDHLEPTDETDDQKHSMIRDDLTLAPPDQRGGKNCCPWCLAAADTFEHHADGRVGCGYCDAAIPVGADWYERGENITV